MQLPIAPDPTAPITLGLLGMTEGALARELTALQQQPYRARQVFDWIYKHKATSFEAMSNLPKALRTVLAERYHLCESTIVADRLATDQTRKLLLAWNDGRTSECVLIPDGDRRTACISTQVGCPVGCVFCASGIGGVERDLTAAQIVEQAVRVRDLCGDGPRLSNVVFMGLGEPLANFDNVVAALRIINDDHALNIGARKITVSTVGLPKQMRRLADERLQITLALSLHAPTDALRAELIPWAAGVKLADLVDACRYYFDRTGREVTLEYVLLGGINDQPTLANQLADLCKQMRANVNLIRYNPVEGLPYERPTSEHAQRFLEVLRARAVNAHARRSRGLDIDGACGQLRRRHGANDPQAGD